MAEEIEDNLIELEDEDGNILKCALYDIIEFEGKQYAILIDATNGIDTDDPETIVVKYTEDDVTSYFETIDDDDEFYRVSEYIDNMLEEEESFDEEEE